MCQCVWLFSLHQSLPFLMRLLSVKSTPPFPLLTVILSCVCLIFVKRFFEFFLSFLSDFFWTCVFNKKKDYRLLIHTSENRQGNSLAAQWLKLHTSTARVMGSIPRRGTKILSAVQCDRKTNKTPACSLEGRRGGRSIRK